MKELHEYPPILKAEHVAEIIGTSKCNAYRIMDRKDFPLVKVGRLKRVGRDSFISWMENQSEVS